MSTELCEKGNLNEFIIRELLYKKPQEEDTTANQKKNNQLYKTKASAFQDEKNLKLDFQNLDSLLLGDGPSDEIMTPEATLVKEDEDM